jgi:hypothetical protein
VNDENLIRLDLKAAAFGKRIIGDDDVEMLSRASFFSALSSTFSVSRAKPTITRLPLLLGN